MRRLNPSIFLTLLTMCLPLCAVRAQVLTVGPAVPLPPMPSFQAPSVVGLPEGGFAMASSRPTSHRTADLYVAIVDGDGETVLNDWRSFQHIPTAIDLQASPGGFVYTNLDLADLNLRNRLLVGLFDPRGDGSLEQIAIQPGDSFPTAYDITALPDGQLVAAWTDEDLDADRSGRPGLMVRRFSLGDGGGFETPLVIAEGSFLNPLVAATADGGFLVVWQRQDDLAVFAQAFDGNDRGGPVRRVVAEQEAVASLELSALPDGRFVLVWSEVDGGDPSMIYARRLNAQGQAFDETIAVSSASDQQKSLPKVASDRFGRSWVVWMETTVAGVGEVQLRLLNADGSVGGGVRMPPAEDGDQRQPDVVVDANGLAMVVWSEGSGQETRLRARAVKTDDLCSPDGTVLCLHDGRFQVEVEWTDYQGLIGPGHVVPYQSSDSGLFWFFNDRNWELMVKVIDGCSFNGFYWVYAAATTDVAYRMVVTDTMTGLQQVYENQLGDAAPATTDSVALMSCPLGPP